MKHRKTVLPNGIRILTIPMRDNPTATVMVLVEAGSKYETSATNGVSHFLEHLCFKGTTSRTGRELNSELDSLGARTNAFTSYEMTGYYAKGRTKQVERLLGIISDLYLNPTLPPDEIEREKGVIIGEIDMYEDMPMRKVHDLFGHLLYGDQPAGWTILGLKKNIRAFNRDAILAYRKKHYVPQATTIIVSGDIQHAAIVREVRKVFGTLKQSKKHPKKKVVEKQSRPEVLVQYKQTDQTHLLLGYRTTRLGHKDTYALDLLASVLGAGMSSRLFLRLREEMGVGYYVRASHNTFTDTGDLTIAAGVDSARLEEVIRVLLAEVKRLQHELVDTTELSKTKEYVIGNFEMGLESSDDVAEFYGVQEILRQPLETPEALVRKIRAVTPQDIQRVAKKYLIPQNLNLALIGPHKESTKLQQLLEEKR